MQFIYNNVVTVSSDKVPFGQMEMPKPPRTHKKSAAPSLKLVVNKP